MFVGVQEKNSIQALSRACWREKIRTFLAGLISPKCTNSFPGCPGEKKYDFLTEEFSPLGEKKCCGLVASHPDAIGLFGGIPKIIIHDLNDALSYPQRWCMVREKWTEAKEY